MRSNADQNRCFFPDLGSGFASLSVIFPNYRRRGKCTYFLTGED